MKARFIITGGLFLALSAHPTAANAGDEVKLFSLESLIATGERNAGFSDRDGHNFDIVGEPLVTFEAPRDIVRAVVNKYDAYEYQAEGEPHRSVGYSVRIFIEVERSIVGDSGGGQEVVVVVAGKLFNTALFEDSGVLPYLHFPARDVSDGQDIARLFTDKIVLPVSASDITEKGLDGVHIGDRVTSIASVLQASGIQACRLCLTSQAGRGTPVELLIDCGRDLQASALLDDRDSSVKQIAITGGRPQTRAGIGIGTATEKLMSKLGLDAREASEQGPCFRSPTEPGLVFCTSGDPSQVTTIIVGAQ